MTHPAVVDRALSRLLAAAPAFSALDASTQATVHDSLAKIASYLNDDPTATTVALGPPDPLAGYRAAASGSADPSAPGTDGSVTPTPATPPSGTATAPAGAAPSGTATGRVGELARATLSAIDFPSFVASLIQGTFQAIVDASIQQMEAYAELLKNVASTVDRFMTDNVTDSTARDYLADQFGDVVGKDTSTGVPKLTVNRNSSEPMPTFFRDLGFTSRDDLDDSSLDEVAVPAARRQLAQQRQQTLATMVLMGINRVVVDDGEITAKLQFHIDASETAALRFNQTKTTGGNMASRGGRSPFTANAVMVNTTNLNAQSDVNLRTDLTGQVTVKFRSETFPLERFADSSAIQLINSSAKAPPPPVPASGVSGAPASTAGSAAATRSAIAASAPPPLPASSGQSTTTDPWLPRGGAR